MEKVYISYSSSDSYAWLTAISITSLLENNREYCFCIFIFSNGIKENNCELLRKIINKYNSEVFFYDLDKIKEKYDQMRIKAKWDFATFGRLFAASLLPNNIKKLIHIDCDMIITSSIKELIDLDISNKILAGVKECLSVNYRNSINVEKNRILINAGLIVFNLEYIRQHNITKRFTDCICAYKKLEYLDQDILNITISNDEKIILPLKFNSYSVLHYFSYNQLVKLRNPHLFYSKDEVEIAKEKPVILHFTTCRYDFGRPWNIENNHPKKSEFIKYLYKAGFDESYLTHVKKKLSIIIIRKMPLSISCFLSFFINQIIKPFTTRPKKK